MRHEMDIRQAEKYLDGIPRFSKKTTMANERKILELLGHPEEGQKFIHVAGTNGKGSTCAFISSILIEKGYHIGTFISPHLVKVTERFLIDGEQISDEEFLSAFDTVYRLCADNEEVIVHPSYFEFIFLIGMLIFKEKNVEVTVLEVGLGGRLDATNVITDPLVSVIASISLDHTEILGETIEEIAAEKAGIIKRGCPVVYDAGCKNSSEVIERTAEELGADTYPVSHEDFAITARSLSGISFRANRGMFAGEEFSLPFVADYQAVNASLALRALEVLETEKSFPGEKQGEGISESDIVKRALMKTSWPGRMEPVLPGVFMDGAHNEDGIRAFTETVLQMPCAGRKYLLFSAVVEKDYEKMTEEVIDRTDFDGFILTELDTYRALPLEKITSAFKMRTDKPVWSFGNIADAFDFAKAIKKEEDLLFIAGSLYLAGSVKAILSGNGGTAHMPVSQS